ncbi:nucleotide sugar dehydrogenase [Methylocystis sp. SC2]|uniref:nucleotide sugar dehydrogenase n=1 Tax=Methylocystis sp. (strain SC2) TaxID=187303 RepID=UPI00027AF3DE|nr:nucleotide sugar dehydrogenase [Methylocystis sp. SC2]CCJ07845.1 Polysaccharide biosynthesis protein [Methylocystis sp. SC2]
MHLENETIAVVGLGYVGLPIAVEFGKIRPVVGFDIQPHRIAELRSGHDSTREVECSELAGAQHLTYTSDPNDMKCCRIFIVAVPTPVDQAQRPDMTLLKKASDTVGRVMERGSIVVFESTVYPGCTREICVPILEATSGLAFNKDFFVGYSPERINPGDKMHRLPTITKVTSGSTPEAADAVDALYKSIVVAGTHKASSIEVAEAAKVIENTQRDLNIALMNELAIIFHKLGIDTQDVLAAAGTKWNFLRFTPGLVGGHCIGVDPYYLTHRAQEVGYHPEVILAGRRINDRMGPYVADRVARLMMRNQFPVVGSRILVMGLTFKENCPDLRNSKVVDVIESLREFHAEVDVFDPWANAEEAEHETGVKLITSLPDGMLYDAIIVTTAHKEFIEMGPKRLRALGKPRAILFDTKGIFARAESDGRL